MTLRLNGSTSGYVEIDAPATAGSNTLVLPTGNGSANQILKNGGTAGSLAFGTATEDGSGNFAFNSGYGSVATSYGCRAWVNFNGTGTVAIRSSGNVSSITDQATGTYTVNFTTSMPDANYAALVTSGFASGVREDLLGFVYTDSPLAMATSSVSVKFVRADTNAAVDTNYGMVAVFR